MIAILVSESSIVLSALERCVKGEFGEIKKVRKLSQLRSTEDWSEASIIFDMAHAERGLEDLLSFGSSNLKHCVVLTREADDLHALAPLVGVVGAIILDSSNLEDVSQAARMVRIGLHVLPMQMKPMLSRRDPTLRLAREATASLTDRENAVLSLVTQGCSNKVIARKLGVSDSTVRVHVRTVLKKLGVQNRTQAALIVLDRRGKGPQQLQAEPGPRALPHAGSL
jgi:DNA-binding NarL/FixJ family response regulator